MKRAIPVFALVLALAAAGAAFAQGSGKGSHARARLDGYQEVATLSTAGHGSFEGRLGDDEITWSLTYDDLEGTPQAAHLHLGRPGVNGGIVAFLCDSADVPTDNDCPANGGTVEGSIAAADVIGPAGQGIAAGEFDELVHAIRAGAIYANVHTSLYPGGEIRGQVGVDQRRRK